MQRLMYKLYEKSEKPIPYWVSLGNDRAFVWPGAAVMIDHEIYTEPETAGTHETDKAIWLIEDENVYFVRKKS